MSTNELMAASWLVSALLTYLAGAARDMIKGKGIVEMPVIEVGLMFFMVVTICAILFLLFGVRYD